MQNKTTVQIKAETHETLLKLKAEIRAANKELFSIKNDTVIAMALSKLKESGDYEIKL